MHLREKTRVKRRPTASLPSFDVRRHLRSPSESRQSALECLDVIGIRIRLDSNSLGFGPSKFLDDATPEWSLVILPRLSEVLDSMHAPLRQTRSHLMALFEKQGLHPRGDLGQNFLIDLNLLESIVAEAELGPHDVVLEIGAGTGGLTGFLAAESGAVVSVEYDPNMYQLARELVGHLPDVTLLNCDALQSKHQLNRLVLDAVAEQLAAEPGRKLKLVANLPYHVGTPIIANLLASDLPLERMVVTIQYELAQRLSARPHTSDYSALSVYVQSQSRIKIVHKLGPSVFWPRPDVDSAIVRIDVDPEARARIRDRAGMQILLRDIFTQRRKLLRGVLVQIFKKKLDKAAIDQILADLKLSAEARAEELEVGQLVELINRLQQSTNRETLESQPNKPISDA
jgi:16S rRNA (adenine1518-N6/adenine1519-N6)-dimethyltransferase